MSLPETPVIRKFFTNKIESSRPEWGDYLLEIADIFSVFDGEELDREQLSDRFSVISGRSPYSLRDVSNFRDEFGAYGTYLGVFHYKVVDGKCRIYMSKAAKRYLCSTEPDVESFCRTQLSLFQYPNGAGYVQNRNGSIRVQNNAQIDTTREIANNIRLNPLRLLCRTVETMHRLCGIPLSNIIIPYDTIFMLFNDNEINNNFSPSLETIRDALQRYSVAELPIWVHGKELTNFKRNFHILARTGIFARTSTVGLSLDPINTERAYDLARRIANMSENFEAFECCYNATNISASVATVIASSCWGEYYDSLSLPMDVLASISDDIDIENPELYSQPLGIVNIADTPFPPFRTFRTNQIRTFIASGNCSDPYETIVSREKANREHARILNMLAAKLRLGGHEVYENTFIDLYANISDNTYIFEVKSNNSKNTLSQIRKAIAQLYEYRYRSEATDAILCVVLQQKPPQLWVEDYLLNDRGILVCWLVDDVRLESPDECRELLSSIGILD